MLEPATTSGEDTMQKTPLYLQTDIGGDIDDSWKQQNNLYLTHNKYNYNNNRVTDSAGGDQPHENRPPYYAMCFIMRVK